MTTNTPSKLNQLNTNDLVSRLNDRKDIDIRKLIQLKTVQAKQLKTPAGQKTPSGLTSLNFNQMAPPKSTAPIGITTPTLSKRIQLKSTAQSPAPSLNMNNFVVTSPAPSLSGASLKFPINNSNIAKPSVNPPVNTPPPNLNIRRSSDDDDDDDGENLGGDGEGDYDVDDDVDDDVPQEAKITTPPPRRLTPVSAKKQSNDKKGPALAILDDETISNRKEFDIPKGPSNVTIPMGINFGLDMLANKDVLKAINGQDSKENDSQLAHKTYQKTNLDQVSNLNHMTNKNKPSRTPPKEPIKNDNDGDDGDDIADIEDMGDGEGDDNVDVDTMSNNVPSQLNSNSAPIGLNGFNPKNDNNMGGDDDDNGDVEGDVEGDVDSDGAALNIGGDSDNDELPVPVRKSRNLTGAALTAAKRAELTKIERLEKKNYKPSKKYTMTDKLDDMIDERKRLEDDKGCDDSIKWQRKILMGVSSGIEYLNKSYDPFDLQLDGWSESVYENIGDYDEVFEELYHKYKKKVKIAPEIKLIGMFAGSALMFHFSKTLFSKASDQVPGFEDVMKDNPQLKNAYEQAALKKMNINGNKSNDPISSTIGNFFGNNMVGNMIGGLMGKGSAPQKPPGIPSQQTYQQNVTPSMSMQQPPQSHMNNRPPMSMQQPTQSHMQQSANNRPPMSMATNNIIRSQPPVSAPRSQPQPTQSSQPQPSQASAPVNSNIEMDGPSGVDDLLVSLTKGTNADLTELPLSDIDSEGTLSEIGSNVNKVSFSNKRTTKNNNRKKRLNLNVGAK